MNVTIFKVESCMKKLLAFLLAVSMCFVFCACGDNNNEDEVDYESLDTFKVGVLSAEIDVQRETFDSMYSRIGAKGYRLEFVEFNSAEEASDALAAKEIDVSLCSQKHEFTEYEKENPDVLLNLGPLFYTPYALYLCSYEKPDAIEDGCKIAVPSDEEGMARALLLLENLGYIKVSDDAGINVTLDDIEENERGFVFSAVSPDKIADNIETCETDMVVMSAETARAGGYKVNFKSIGIENYLDVAVLDQHFLLLVNRSEISSEKYKAVSTFFFSPMMYDSIADSTGSYMLPAFSMEYGVNK